MKINKYNKIKPGKNMVACFSTPTPSQFLHQNPSPGTKCEGKKEGSLYTVLFVSENWYPMLLTGSPVQFPFFESGRRLQSTGHGGADADVQGDRPGATGSLVVG